MYDKFLFSVPIPNMYSHYNTKVGGIDLLDYMVSIYWVSYRMKSSGTCSTLGAFQRAQSIAWQLRMSAKGTKEPSSTLCATWSWRLSVHGTASITGLLA
jgi:hypothetical protein